MSKKNIKKSKILIWDKNAVRLIQIRNLLKELDIETVETTDHPSFISKHNSGDFFLTLCNVTDENDHNFNALKPLQEKIVINLTPIIFYFEFQDDSQEILEKIYNMRFCEHLLIKDFNSALVSKISIYIDQYKKNQKIKELNIAKSRFLSGMSHELRTPLNSILILAKLLSENQFDHLNNKEIKYSSTIYKSGTELLNLTNDILDISKIEAGKIELIPEIINLEGFVESLKRKISPSAKDKNLDIVFNISPDFNEITNDESRLTQILNNLLSNAIKFTSKGSIELEILPLENDFQAPNKLLNKKDGISFRVSDTGIGIPEDRKDAIFHPFEQANKRIQPMFGGTGLGLSISKKLAEEMGGDLILEKTRKSGSVFSLHIPSKVKSQKKKKNNTGFIAPANSIVPPISKPPEKENGEIESKLKGVKVLVAEDDIVNVYVLLSLLEKSHMIPIVASNGKEAIEKAQSNSDIDIVLMDMMMPEMDGYEASTLLKTNEKTKHIPIIAVTANAMVGDKEKCLLAGADGYVPKPIFSNILIEEIIKCLNNKHK